SQGHVLCHRRACFDPATARPSLLRPLHTEGAQGSVGVRGSWCETDLLEGFDEEWQRIAPTPDLFSIAFHLRTKEIANGSDFAAHAISFVRRWNAKKKSRTAATLPPTPPPLRSRRYRWSTSPQNHRRRTPT